MLIPKTPFYYYDTALLQATLDEITSTVANYPHFHVHYALKANANPTLLRLIQQAGLGVDCVSGGEVQVGIDNGFDASKIVYAGVGKSDEEILLALKHGIFCFNVESIPELEVINELAQQVGKVANVCLRINPDVEAHTHANIVTGKAENKFGIALGDMLHVIELAQSLSHIQFLGLHFHIGSQITDMQDYLDLCERVNDIQDHLNEEGIYPSVINVGGGLGIDYHDPDKHPIPDFKTYFEIFAEHLRLREGQTVHFELGRSVVAQCGTLIARVLYVKQAATKQFVIIDAGINLIEGLIEGIVSAIPIIIEKIPTIVETILGLITEELPKILEMGESILESLIQGILTCLPKLLEMLPTLIETFVKFITDNLPKIIDSGINLLMSLINGIVEAIPILIKMLPTIIDTVVNVLLENLPYIIECGFDLLIGLIDGILGAIPDLIEMLPDIITTIVSTLIKEFPKILELGGKILWELIKGLGKVLVHLGVKIYEINEKIHEKFREGLSKMGEIGENLVKGLWEGIKNTTQWILDKIKGFGQSVMDGIKNIFGIKSPSRLMRDQVGKNLALGIGVGFEDEMKNVTKQMQDSLPTSFETTVSTGTMAQANSTRFEDMVSAFKEALSQVKIEMDDEEMGKFVDKTVTNLVYT